MSQHFQYDEPSEGYLTGYAPSVDYEEAPRIRPDQISHFDEFPAQKLDHKPATSSTSAGGRLALAIVSVVVLIPLISMLLGDPDLSITTLVFRIVALGLICLTLMVINLAFNRGSSAR